uniref:Uncharacterized protein n=1 Tax=Anguilla anguilla TaxID=7936 RepID=A0A0E9WCX3_ANGAN
MCYRSTSLVWLEMTQTSKASRFSQPW